MSAKKSRRSIVEIAHSKQGINRSSYYTWQNSIINIMNKILNWILTGNRTKSQFTNKNICFKKMVVYFLETKITITNILTCSSQVLGLGSIGIRDLQKSAKMCLIEFAYEYGRTPQPQGNELSLTDTV